MPDLDVNPNSINFRGVQGERDYPLLVDICQSSLRADKNETVVTLEDAVQAFKPTEQMDPTRDGLIASLDGVVEPVGYSRVGWYSSRADTRLYFMVSHLRQQYRGTGIWQVMVLQSERRLREIATEHVNIPNRFYQAWTDDHQLDWMEVLLSCGYKVVRRFNNMLYQLGEAPNIPLPAGFEIRPVQPEHMRQIWEAQKELNDGLFENVAEDWLEDKYPAWLEISATQTPQFWQVAWVGDQVAGMVLAHIDEKQNAERNQKRGYTEHIYVRPAWRGHGLASALIARSLRVLKAQGMTEAELGVDSENESAAFQLYQRLGYKTFSIDTWLRKSMEV